MDSIPLDAMLNEQWMQHLNQPENRPRIFTAILEPVQACNLHCSYCYATGPERPPMTQDVLRIALRKIIDHVEQAGFDKIDIIWHGGEPLLAGFSFYKFAQQLLQEINSQIHFRQFMQTNGLLLNADWCNFFVKHNIQVGLSIDGPKELHDTYRCDHYGRGTHSRVLEAFHIATMHGLNVGFNAVSHSSAKCWAAKIYSFFLRLGSSFRINPLLPAGRAALMIPNDSIAAEYGQLLCEMFDLWTASPSKRIRVSPLDSFLKTLLIGSSNECQFQPTCAGDYIAIRSDGTANICNRFNSHSLGNILHTNIATLFCAPVAQQLKNRIYALRHCHDCEYWKLCYGGCPYNALLVHGSIEKRDPFCNAFRLINTHLRQALYEVSSY
jgi:uncharacterized protein